MTFFLLHTFFLLTLSLQLRKDLIAGGAAGIYSHRGCETSVPEVPWRDVSFKVRRARFINFATREEELKHLPACL